MENKKNLWVIVLAAGEGTRLRSLTTNRNGQQIPKQYCSFLGYKSMLQLALERAERLAPRERIVVIVSADQKQWWKPELAEWPAGNVIVQPKNRGTAAGVLLPLMKIFLNDPHAHVLVLPSDHYIEEESVLEEAILKMIPLIRERQDRIILFGIEPEDPDSGYGWIIPSSLMDDESAPPKSHHRPEAIRHVASFVEKPPELLAIDLMRRGALWNSFMFVGAAGAFVHLYTKILPDLFKMFLVHLGDLQHWTKSKIAALYERIPTLDFSKDLLEKAVEYLWVGVVPMCGWSDLGTPERLFKCFDRSETSRLAHLPRSAKSSHRGHLRDRLMHEDENTMLRLPSAGNDL